MISLGRWATRRIYERRVGLAVFISIWLVVLAIPSLRLMLHVHLRGSSLMWIENPLRSTPNGDEFNMQRLANLHPNDVRVLAKEVETRDYFERDEEGSIVQPRDPLNQAGASDNPHRKQTEVFDRLIQRFPDNAWLIANRLRFTTNWFRDNRIAGDLERTDTPPFKTPAPERRKERPTFTRAELEQAIGIAKQGRQLEPDNCYFDWMLMLFLMSGNRDEEAVRALNNGARKTRYDDHSADDTRIEIAVHEMVRPLLIEEKIYLDAGVESPYISNLYHLTRLLTWHAMKLERRGQHAQAIRIYHGLTRIAAPMMQGRNALFIARLGAQFQSIAWSANGRRTTRQELIAYGIQPSNSFPGEVEARLRIRLSARKFANYTAAHGEAAIGRGTLQLAKRAESFQPVLYRPAQFLNGISLNTLNSIFSLWLLGIFSILQIGLMLAMSGFLSVLLLFTRPAPVSARVIARSTAFAVFISLGIAALVLYFGKSWWLSDAYDGVDLQLICIAFLVSPIFSVAAIAWLHATIFIYRNRKDLTPTPRYEGESAKHFSRDYLPQAIRLCIGVTALVVFACWIAAGVAWQNSTRSWTLPFGFSPALPPLTIDDPATTLSVTANCLAALFYLGWLIQWRWYAPKHLRPIMHGALYLYRRTLGIFIIVSAMFYLLFATISLVPRRQAEARFNEYLRIGEIASLQQK